MHYFLWVGPGVENVYQYTVLVELADNVDHSGVADVGAVFLERYTKDKHLCTLDFVISGNHKLDHFGGNVFAHIVVETTARKNDFRIIAILLRFLTPSPTQTC